MGTEPVEVEHQPEATTGYVERARSQWRSHHLGAAGPHFEAATALHHMRNLVVSRAEQELKAFDVTFAQYEALIVLYVSAHESMPLGQLSKHLLIHPTTVTNTVDQLEKKQLVRRVRSDADRRLVLAKITPTGKEAVRKVSEHLATVSYGVAELSQTDAGVLAHIMQQFLSAAEDTTPR